MNARRAARSPRWTRRDWIEHGIHQLKSEGPGAVTLERMCETANRTRGSFYHHFATMGDFIAEVTSRWRRTDTDDIRALVLGEPSPREGLRLLSRLSDRIDHRVELGVRALALTVPAVRAIVDRTDGDREAFLTDLLRRAYGLDARRAGDAARLFHALHLAGLMRSPDRMREFSLGPTRALIGWLEQDAPAASARARPLKRRRG